MRTKGTWSLRYLSGKIMAGLVLATMICSLDVGSAIAGHDDDRGRRYDNDHRWRGHDRGRHEGRRYRNYRYRETVRYVEPAPVYIPPPVYYAPPPEPGIRIFLPSIRIN